MARAGRWQGEDVPLSRRAGVVASRSPFTNLTRMARAPKHPLRVALVLSLALNAGLLAGFAWKAYHKWFGFADEGHSFRDRLFRDFPRAAHQTYFVGDSHTERFELAELLHSADVCNRGIGGDRTAGVLHRIGPLVQAQPAKVFLLIGVNDVLFGPGVNEAAANLEQVLQRFRAGAPRTRLYVQSVLPTDWPRLHSTESALPAIQELNRRYAALARAYGATFLDLYPAFSGPAGLNEAYSLDGLHLNGKGYVRWAELLAPHVTRAAGPAAAP